jgi:Integrase zinc binding domain
LASRLDTLPEFLRPYTTSTDELTVAGPFVFKGSRVVVPFGARDDVIARLHKSHNGTIACLRRARETVYFPGISNAIKQTVSQCFVCQRDLTETSKLPLQSHSTPSRPRQRVSTDIFTHSGIDYLLCVDYLSGYFEIDRLPSKSSKDVIYTLRQQFARHGIPEVVISDNSPFGSDEFSAFALKWEFEHQASSPNYPQSNGWAENAVKTAKRIMRRAAESGTDPMLALLEWRNTPTETSNVTPTLVMFGRRFCLFVWLLYGPSTHIGH